ncbi:hypothetical protein BGZ58_000400 [Dissophora ornata]|nr:hypothetical protein BGZ58_000400 [Dissophora ornata]
MRIDAAIADPSSSSSEAATRAARSTENTELDDSLGNNGLTRTESRRPPKSAQRTRSISTNSFRLSHTPYNDNGESIGEKGNWPDSQASSPQEVATPTFGPTVTHRQIRPYPSSPALAIANGQSASVSSSPRLPARSNSRSFVKSSAPGSSSFEQASQGSPAPSIPPRSRSGSRPQSRINTGVPEQNGPYVSTPTIAESQEYASKQQHMQKKSSSNTLRGHNESEDSVDQSLAPSLLPSDPIPPPSSDQYDRSISRDQAARPALRKQTSTDPAAIYRQQQQDPSVSHDRVPSHHMSERRPTRDNGQSGGGNSAYVDIRDENRFKDPSGDAKQGTERGRSQRQEEEDSKGGIFKWARSRSKSKDASASRQNPDAPTYPEYNPALIPSRSASSAGMQRAKSVPRKPSNQSLQGNGDGRPPYSAATLNNVQPPTPSGSTHLQHNKSISKPGINPSNDASTSQPAASLNVSTNTNTTYHEKMIRGMGMGSTPIVPAVLLTPQPSFPTTSSGSAPPGGMRNMALAMMKQEGSPSSSELQMQQRQHQLQQTQMLHLQQQQRLAASAANSTSPPATPTSPRNQVNALQNPLSHPTGAAGAGAAAPTQRLVATRIYIQTETDFKSLNLAPNTTALDALQMLQQRGTFGEPGDGRYHDRWTVFEYSKEFLIERPLRDFEVLLDIMKTWEADKDNKMICKGFPARGELSAKEIIRLVGPAGQQGFVRPHGWVHLETKKSKWVKRYLHITDTAVYHSKDSKFNGESMLCLLRNFDVYSVQVPRKKAPTKFGFAMKSSDSIHMYETPEDDYIHYICVESGESLREWLVGLRAAKGMFMYNANPEVVREGQRHADELMSSANQDGLLSRGNLTDEQVSMAEAKLAGLGMSLSSSLSLRGNRSR